MKTLLKLLIKNNLDENLPVTALCITQHENQFFLMHEGQSKQIAAGENMLLDDMTITFVSTNHTESDESLAVSQESSPTLEASQALVLPLQYHSLLRPLVDSDDFGFSVQSLDSAQRHSVIRHLANPFHSYVNALESSENTPKTIELKMGANDEGDILKELDLL